MAYVAVERRVVLQPSAATTEQRIAGVVGRACIQVTVFDAEVGDAIPTFTQGGDAGIVGVEDEVEVGRRCGDYRAPALSHHLDLAKAVELVSKQVGEYGDCRRQLGKRLRHGRLVHLEDAEASLGLLQAAIRAGGQRQGGRDAARQIRPAAVGERRQPGGASRLTDQQRGGGLAVRAGDDDAARPDLRREVTDQSRVEPEADQAAGGGAAASPQGLTRFRGSLCRPNRSEGASGGHGGLARQRLGFGGFGEDVARQQPQQVLLANEADNALV